MKLNKKDLPVIIDEKDRKLKENKRTLIILTIISILFASIYFFFTFTNRLDDNMKVIIMIIFLSILTVFSFTYVFYNRGFTQKNITIEVLPADWSKEAKETYLNAIKMRANKSKWMIYIIFPLVITLALDSILLYVVPFFIDLFN